MKSSNQLSKIRLWTSYALQAIIIIFFLIGAVSNIFQSEAAVNGAISMGYPKSAVLYLGIILLVSTVLYVIPKTASIGAILLTAWLGGAVATHIIHHDPLNQTLFPVIFGILLWLSLWLRIEKIRHIIL